MARQRKLSSERKAFVNSLLWKRVSMIVEGWSYYNTGGGNADEY